MVSFRYRLELDGQSWDVEAPTRGGSDGLWLFTHASGSETVVGAAAVLSLERVVLKLRWDRDGDDYGWADEEWNLDMDDYPDQYESMLLAWEDAATFTEPPRCIFHAIRKRGCPICYPAP